MEPLQASVLEGRGLIALRGADTRSFLQSLLSNDVEQLRPTQALYAALLTPQGRCLFDLIVVDTADAVLLEVERARAAELVQRLSLYRLRADVQMTDLTERMAVVALFGSAALSALGLPVRAGAARTDDGAILLTDPRRAELGARLIAEGDRLGELLQRFGVTRVDPSSYQAHRIASGVPEGVQDLDKALLLECNFEELHGVSFDKGCFVGQELTARMKYRGLRKKRLVPVRVEGPLPEPGTPIMADTQEAGELRSGLGDRALALLRLDYLSGASELRAGNSRIVPAPPLWLQASFRATA